MATVKTSSIDMLNSSLWSARNDYLLMILHDLIGPVFIRSIVGGIVSLLILVVILFLAYWVYSDASDRGSNHAFAWGVAVLLLFLMGLLPGIVVFALYLIIRDDF